MPRNAPQYSAEERKVLNIFKDEYRKKVDSKQRDVMLRSKIFPSMFNYWRTPPESLTEEAKSRKLKDLKRWIINNWRSYGKADIGKRHRKLTYIDMLCRTRVDDVKAEVKAILEEEDLEETEQHIFQQRRRAAKRVYQRMNDKEKQEIDAMVEAQAAFGNAVDIRESKADKGAWKSAQRWSRDAWLDMGVLSITFFAYVKPNKKLAVDICDDMAKHVNAPHTFVKKHSREVEDIKKHFIDYVKAIYPRNQIAESGNQHAAESGNQQAAAGGNQPASGPSPTADVYPSLANTQLTQLSKKQLVDLMRRYLRKHYKLATGGKYKRIPYKRIEADPSAFIDPMYCPSTITLKDPQNMPMEDIKVFLSHIQARETDDGTAKAFHFRKYWRNGHRDAAYPAEELADGRQSMQAAPSPITGTVGNSIRHLDGKQDAPLPSAEAGHHQHVKRHQGPVENAMGNIATTTARDSGRLAIEPLTPMSPRSPIGPAEPLLAVPNAAMPTGLHPNILIGQEAMSKLTAIGFPASIPVNGPEDGEPMYYMLQDASAFGFPHNIDPRLLS